MKIFFLSFVFLSISLSGYSQRTDSLIRLIYKQKTDTARINRMYDVFDLTGEIGPVNSTAAIQKVLSLTKKNKDRVGEAITSAELGYVFFYAGSTVQGTRLMLEAIKIAEETGNAQAIGIVYQNFAGTQADINKNKELMEKAILYSTKAGDNRFLCYEYLHISTFYTNISPAKLDSALYYAEKTYSLAKVNSFISTQCFALTQLAKVHKKLGNDDLALAYIRTADKITKRKFIDQDARAEVYAGYINFFNSKKQLDSAFFYAYKGLAAARKGLIRKLLGPTDALRKLYEPINADSSLKYTKMYYDAKDSFTDIQKSQQIQALNFEEIRRQETLSTAKELEKEIQKQNLQYAAIAMALVIFALLFFLFSHSVIATQRTIKFLGILSLLIVFEFINLLIHPYIGKLTHHSPVLMLLFMVFLAALLIPLHHKLEHWITDKMVEKNKKIRLASAKKIIAELETENL